MGRASKHISVEDQKFIRDNHLVLTVREICNKRRLNYNHVWNFMEHRGLSKHSVRNKPVKKKEEKEDKGKMFNPNKFNNWMV